MSKFKNTKEPRLSLQGLRVLQMFAASPCESVAGVDVRKATGLSTGTLYPILLRFEEAGWLTSKWENVDPSEAGRPRKRLYRISSSGCVKAREVLASFDGVLTA